MSPAARRRLRRRRLQPKRRCRSPRRRHGVARVEVRTARRGRPPPPRTAPKRPRRVKGLQTPSPPRRTVISSTSRCPSGSTSWSPRVSYTADSRAPSPRFHAMATYAIISLGGKQYRVREGERLLVDRLETDEGKTFQPAVLFTGGDGESNLAPRVEVTAMVVGHVRGEKIRIGKRRPKSGYRRQT